MELLKLKRLALPPPPSPQWFSDDKILSFIIISLEQLVYRLEPFFDNPNFILFILFTSVPPITAACELLYLLKEDFDWLLKPKLKEHLSDIRTALGRFDSYFKSWTEAQVREEEVLGFHKVFTYQLLVCFVFSLKNAPSWRSWQIISQKR